MRTHGLVVVAAAIAALTSISLGGPTEANAAPRSGERPLPSFSGRSLDRENISASAFIGKRLVLFFFNPEVADADMVGRAVASVAAERNAHNFGVLGIAMGSNAAKAKAFAQRAKLDFPIIDDANANVSQRFGLRQPLLILGADSEGFMSWSVGYFNADAPNPSEVVEDQLREKLRLPERTAASAGALFQPPAAPLFETNRLEGGTFKLADLKGQPLVLIFFLHTCPHCHAALEFLQHQLTQLPEGKRPKIVGVSLANRPRQVSEMVEERGFDFLEVLMDPGNDIGNLYGVFGGVPVLNYIDAQGRIQHRTSGWDKGRDPSLGRMYLAKIAGAKIPMLLSKRGYTGNDVCAVCHDLEQATWQFTTHATAFDTLVTHGSDRDPECVGCHSVGFEKPGGFDLDRHSVHLENVGCESCHGRGGGHLQGEPKVADYENESCAQCHDQKHSLGFDYASFRPQISHVGIAALSQEQREALVADRAKPRDVLPHNAEVVGSEACQTCHAAEFATWSDSPHGHAIESLARTDQADDATCLGCHTTAYGRPGGFPKQAKSAAHPDLARVGCESCHGPGGNHVPDGATRLGTIVSLGDKCDSCVILQICGSCHDDANDPQFEFEVQEKIDLQRHGTIEAGTGKPLAAGEAGP